MDNFLSSDLWIFGVAFGFSIQFVCVSMLRVSNFFNISFGFNCIPLSTIMMNDDDYDGNDSITTSKNFDD